MRWITFGALGAAAALGLGSFSLATGCTVTTTQTDFPDGGEFTLGDGGHADAHASSDGGGGGGGGGTGSCADFCAKAASASCPSQSTCESDCTTQTSKVPAACSDAWDAVLQCGATTGSFNSCDSQGKPKLSGCDTETQTFVSCLTSGGGGGGKDAGGGGGGSCGNLQTGNAACDTCMKNSCCTQTAACDSNAACVAILQCFTDDNCSADACYTNCENQHTSGVTAEQNMYSCMQNSCASACQ